MTSDKLELIKIGLNCLTSLVSIITLIFLYFQIQNLKKSIKNNAYTNIIDMVTDNTKIMVDNPEMSYIWGDPVNDKSNIKELWLIELFMDQYEFMYEQYKKEKIISEDIWSGWKTHISDTFKNSDQFNYFWVLKKNEYSKEFGEFINSLVNSKK